MVTWLARPIAIKHHPLERHKGGIIDDSKIIHERFRQLNTWIWARILFPQKRDKFWLEMNFIWRRNPVSNRLICSYFGRSEDSKILFANVKIFVGHAWRPEKMRKLKNKIFSRYLNDRLAIILHFSAAPLLASLSKISAERWLDYSERAYLSHKILGNKFHSLFRQCPVSALMRYEKVAQINCCC